MKENIVSPNFTVEDIHAIRENNYQHVKDMSIDEKIEYYNNRGKVAEQEIEKRRMLVKL